jgi:DNA-binding protein HU-beta
MVRRRDKADTMGQLAQRAGLEHRTVAGLWPLLLALAVETTRQAGEFQLPGIGKIVKRMRKARTGRNPQTGQRLIIPAKEVLQFRFMKSFKDAALGTQTKGRQAAHRSGRKAA